MLVPDHARLERPPGGSEPLELRLRDRRVGLLELDIAAEQHARVALQRRLHAAVQDADRGDDRHAQRQGREQDGEAAAGAAQVAQGEAQGQQAQPPTAAHVSAATAGARPLPARAAGRGPWPAGARSAAPGPDRG